MSFGSGNPRLIQGGLIKRPWHILGCGPKDVKAADQRCLDLLLILREESSVGPDELEDVPSHVPTLGILSMIAILILTFVANILVLVLFLQRPKLRSHSNIFIVSLALADLGVALALMPFSILTSYHDSHWILGNGLCLFWLVSDSFFCSLSVVCLLFVALDRFQAVINPITYAKRKDTKGAVCSQILAWFFSLLLTLPTVLAIVADQSVINYERCAMVYNQRTGFVILTSLTSYFIPIFLLYAIYGIIVFKRKMKKSGSSEMSARDVRLFRILGLLLLTFTSCWTPFWSAYLLVPFCNDFGFCYELGTNPKWQLFLQWLGYFNSTMNPFIYAFLSKDFRIALNDFLSSIGRHLRNVRNKGTEQNSMMTATEEEHQDKSKNNGPK